MQPDCIIGLREVQSSDDDKNVECGVLESNALLDRRSLDKPYGLDGWLQSARRIGPDGWTFRIPFLNWQNAGGTVPESFRIDPLYTLLRP